MKKASSQSVKQINTQLVLEKLIEKRESSRIELSRLTTLNKATVSSIISDLIDKQLVKETAKTVKTSGRSANVIALDKNAGRIISIELLPKEIYGVIANLYGEILFEVKEQVINPEFSSYLKDLLQVIDTLKSNTFDSTYGLIGIGIGVYGILSKDKKIKFATFNSWRDIDIKSIIEEYTGIETFVENEANISALGEMVEFPNAQNVITFNIGTGVGLGVVINNNLYIGEDGYAGEIGHTILIPNGRKCICGNNGCLERYISNDAIVERYFELSLETISFESFIERYKKQDEHAIAVFKEFIEYVSISVNNISQLFNPKVLVINNQIIEQIPESLSIIKNNLVSKIGHIDILTLSKYQSKTNVLGLTHMMIKHFLNIKNYNPKR